MIIATDIKTKETTEFEDAFDASEYFDVMPKEILEYIKLGKPVGGILFTRMEQNTNNTTRISEETVEVVQTPIQPQTELKTTPTPIVADDDTNGIQGDGDTIPLYVRVNVNNATFILAHGDRIVFEVGGVTYDCTGQWHMEGEYFVGESK